MFRGRSCVSVFRGTVSVFGGRSQVSVFRLMPGRAQANPLLCCTPEDRARAAAQWDCPCVTWPRAAAVTTAAPWQHHEDPAPGSQQHSHHGAEAGARGREVGATEQEPGMQTCAMSKSMVCSLRLETSQPYHRFAALPREPGHSQKKPHRVQITIEAPQAALELQLSRHRLLGICRWAAAGHGAAPPGPEAAGITC